jgi:hypothetical protein
MAKRDDIPKTDPSEIEAIIQRLASPANNDSIKRLKQLIFGPASDRRTISGAELPESKRGR